MATYAIGDIQGCLGALERLLDRIAFDPSQDRLLLAGDLVARGEDSLGTLRLLYRHRDAIQLVLGNHDLHLLAIAAGTVALRKKEQDLAPILAAADGPELLAWLQAQPLALDLPEFGAVMVHAGLPPLWSPAQLLARAAEVETAIREQPAQYFAHMYGNEPLQWQEDLAPPLRWRVITNYLTRMRFVDADGALDLSSKGEADAPPPGYAPWYLHPARDTGTRVLFGHWAALAGNTDGGSNITALDTGCVWGGQLSALRLEDNRFFRCECGPSAA